jgi:hypothetical protein
MPVILFEDIFREKKCWRALEDLCFNSLVNEKSGKKISGFFLKRFLF